MAMFAGPAPGSGGHFIDSSGNINNSSTSGRNNTSLLFPVYCVDNFSYDLNIDRTDIKQLGRNTYVGRPIINQPTVNLSFDYYLTDFSNENTLGFYVTPSGSGQYLFPLSGFASRELTLQPSFPQYPYSYRDKRNLFLVIGPQGSGVLDQNTGNLISNNLFCNSVSSGYNVVSFGNCYITNYRSEVSINNIPKVTVSYIAENVVFNTSGSGVDIPALTPNRNTISGVKFHVPLAAAKHKPLLPQDIDISILSNTNQPITGLGIDFTNMFVEGYTIDLPLNRESLNALGYTYPLDRELNFPIIAGLGFKTTLPNTFSGNLFSYVKRDDTYNVVITLKAAKDKNARARYSFLGAKLNSANYTASVQDFKRGEFRFSVEINPEETGKGIFFSGAYDPILFNRCSYNISQTGSLDTFDTYSVGSILDEQLFDGSGWSCDAPILEVLWFSGLDTFDSYNAGAIQDSDMTLGIGWSGAAIIVASG